MIGLMNNKWSYTVSDNGIVRGYLNITLPTNVLSVHKTKPKFH